jgi:hypothetical protein
MPSSRGGQKFSEYKRKIEWIFTDIKSYPHFSEEVREGMREEMKSDPFAFASIIEKAALLSPKQREMLEEVIEKVLKDESFEIKVQPHDKL